MNLRLLIIILPLVLCGFGSCSAHLSDVCQVRLPEYQQAYEEADLALKNHAAGRALASSGNPANAYGEEERDRWMNWAEKYLKETQYFMDIAESDGLPGHRASAVRKELSLLANEWVAFHGFSQAGKISQMGATLRRIRERTHTARDLACDAPGK